MRGPGGENWRRMALGIFACALLMRGVFILTLQDGYYFPDSVAYSAAAERLLTQGELGADYSRSPLYPLFLAGIYLLFGQHIVAVRLVEALMGAGLAVVIAVLGRRIGGTAVGALAGALWSIYPLAIFIAGLVYPTGVATTLLACAMLCLVTAEDQELAPGPVFLGGILLGLAALAVPVALLTVITAALWIAYRQRIRRILSATLFVCGVGLVLAPWTVRNLYVHQRLVIVEPRIVEQLPHLYRADRDRVANPSTGHPKRNKIMRILDRPYDYAAHVAREFGNFWELYPQRIKMNNPAFREKMHAYDDRILKESTFTGSWTSRVSLLSVGPMFFFALIGTGAMWFRKTRRPELLLLCSTILSFAIGYSFFAGKLRYRIPVEPYIVILSAYGLTQIWIALARERRRKPRSDAETSQLAVH